jgi:hypothetical protein
MSCERKWARRKEEGDCQIDLPCLRDRKGGDLEVIFVLVLVAIREQWGRPDAVLTAVVEEMGVAVSRAHVGGLAGKKVKCAGRDRVPMRRLRRGDGQQTDKNQDPETHRKNPELDGDFDPARYEALIRPGKSGIASAHNWPDEPMRFVMPN